MNSVIKFGLAIAISGLAACGQQDQAVSNVAAANDVDQPLADGSLTTGNDAGAMHAAPPAPDPNVAANARTRLLYDEPKFRGYEVVLDVWSNVPAYGILLVPKNAQGKLPAVVCQHGLEGVPEDTVADDPKHKGYGPYKGFASKLAERGFIVYAPHNPYRGQDKFRVLQRKANPLGHE